MIYYREEPVALNQDDILHILQNANSVPLGQPIWESTEEYNKLKAIIESAVAYTHPAELTDEEIKEVIRKHWNREYGNRNMLTLCKAILKEANK